MSQIITRALDNNHDILFGQNHNNFLVDIDAVAQIIDCSLLLFQGEWWKDKALGLPLFQQILGSMNGYNATLISDLIRVVIMQAAPPFVIRVSNVSASYSTDGTFKYSSTAETVFGPIQVAVSLPAGA